MLASSNTPTAKVRFTKTRKKVSEVYSIFIFTACYDITQKPPTLLPEAVKINRDINAWLSCVRKHPLTAEEQAKVDAREQRKAEKAARKLATAESEGEEDGGEVVENEEDDEDEVPEEERPEMCDLCLDLYKNATSNFYVSINNRH